MLKISLMDQSDLELAYEIEKEVNPTPWSKKNFFSSFEVGHNSIVCKHCLLYTSPSPRDLSTSRMPSSA